MSNLDQDNEDFDAPEGGDETIEMFGEAEARWYQVAARNMVEEALEKCKTSRVLVVQPTGSGKTLTNGLILMSRRVHAAVGVPGMPLRVMFIAHKHRLLSQAERTYASENGIVAITEGNLKGTAMYKPGPTKTDALVEIYYQSAFSSLPADLEYDMVIMDEAHHEAMSTLQMHLEKMGDRPIIGLTATPDRADGCVIKFDVIVNPISREQAVEEGWLAPTHIHTFVDVPSKDKIDVLTNIMGDYAGQMGQTMVFVRTKNEVRAIVSVLEGLGYNAVGILDQNERELNSILDEFSAGDSVQFIVNCNKINEGVDVKGCTDVVCGRQFGSYAQLNQVIGRAARPDSACNVWELINPLSGRNLDTTVVVGTPESHRLISKEGGNWVERSFDYITHRTNKQLGVASGTRIVH